MKFSKSFLEILKHFSNINQNMYFRKGKIQSSVIRSGKNTGAYILYARANTDTEIETPFAIMELHKLLAIISTFSNPDIVVESPSKLLISEGDKVVSYNLSVEKHITYDDKYHDLWKISNVLTSFGLSKENLSNIMKTGGILGSEYLSVISNGKIMELLVDNGNKNGDFSNLYIGEYGDVFRASVKINNLIIIPDDYVVSVTNKVIHLESNTMEYYVPLDSTVSKF